MMITFENASTIIVLDNLSQKVRSDHDSQVITTKTLHPCLTTDLLSCKEVWYIVYDHENYDTVFAYMFYACVKVREVH